MHTLAQVRINLKLQKASYFKKRAPNLGHVVKLSNPENISQILEWLIPKNVTEVREVLGIAHIVENLSRTSLPLLEP